MTGFTKKQQKFILERDGGICLMWGSNPSCTYLADTANHRINRGAGGSRAMNMTVNGCGICATCNGLIESDADMAEVARTRGVKVRSSHNPSRDLVRLSEVPLSHPTRGVYFLDAYGHRIDP